MTFIPPDTSVVVEGVCLATDTLSLNVSTIGSSG